MRALTIQQPYCWAILRGGKDVENRKVAWNYRGPLAVHAGQRYAGTDAYATVARLSSTPVEPPGSPNQDPAWAFGAIVGVVDVVGVHRSGECGAADGRGCSPWAEPFSAHMELANPRALKLPIVCNGRQGLWIPEPPVLAALKRATA